MVSNNMTGDTAEKKVTGSAISITPSASANSAPAQRVMKKAADPASAKKVEEKPTKKKKKSIFDDLVPHRKRPVQPSNVIGDRKKILGGGSNFYTREAYKTLRTNVGFALADSEGSKVLLVTSALQSEGKSITSLNLAISLAEAGNRVMLVDCDLRKPKLGTLLEISSENGLSDVLIHPELMGEAVHVYRKNLSVLFAGHIPPNPSELLGSARMGKMIRDMREKYDYIIIDTPPVNMVTDACVAATWSDGVLFVVRAGQSERGAVIHAVEQINYAKAKVLGFILNGVSSEGGNYTKYRYKRYGNYSRYGYSKYSRYGYSGNRYNYGGYTYGGSSGGYGYGGYGYGSGSSGYGYGYGGSYGGYGYSSKSKGYGYGYGYGYGSKGGNRIPREEAYDAVAAAAEEARERAKKEEQ